MTAGPDTLIHPVPPQPEALLVAQAKTLHFWIFAASQLAGVVLHSAVVAQSGWVTLTADLLPIVQLVAYQIAALWSPPRADWNDAQRFSHYARQLRAAGYRVEREEGHES